MSYASALRTFATQAADARAEIFAGALDANGHNLQLGDVPFLAPFTLLAAPVEMESHGVRFFCTAKITVRRSLNLVVKEDSVFTHLPTGQRYEVGRIGPDNPAVQELPVLLRLLDP